MIYRYPELPDWEFDGREVSPYVYNVKGTDRFGRFVEKTGIDAEALLEECRQDALRIVQAVADKENERGGSVDSSE